MGFSSHELPIQHEVHHVTDEESRKHHEQGSWYRRSNIVHHTKDYRHKDSVSTPDKLHSFACLACMIASSGGKGVGPTTQD